VSDKLRKQIDVERQQLRRLIDEHRPLLESCVSSIPTAIEVSALATFLHSFYSGIENSLKRIAIEIDGVAPSGDAWHRQLLTSMATVTDRRPAVLSATLNEVLREYLAFRHFFRQAYSFHFDWSKMSHLVLNAEGNLKLFETEVDTFIVSVS
jgi:hypothetical protein